MQLRLLQDLLCFYKIFAGVMHCASCSKPERTPSERRTKEDISSPKLDMALSSPNKRRCWTLLFNGSGLLASAFAHAWQANKNGDTREGGKFWFQFVDSFAITSRGKDKQDSTMMLCKCAQIPKQNPVSRPAEVHNQTCGESQTL